jgi:hypothetical protein
MGTWFKIYIKSRSLKLSLILYRIYGIDLSMRKPGLLMESFANYLTAAHNYATYQRIRIGHAFGRRGQPETSSHEFMVIGPFHQAEIA